MIQGTHIQTPTSVRLPAVALLMVLVLASLPVLQANAQEPTPEPTPEGAASGCFGGALSRDPLHCYVFEEAQREGIIEIDAIYEGGDGLFIYLKQTEPLGEDLALYFIGKARAEVRRSGGDECVFRDFHCDVGILKRGYERWGFILPVSTVYEDIRVRVGGAESRRLELGWASYRKVWPASADDSAADNGSRSAEIFDISDVDTTTFPEVDCRETPKASYSCGRWRASPGLGVAGAYGNGLFLWLHVKAAPGDEEKLASAREAYANAYNTNHPDRLTIVPAKYDFGEMWRWQVLLDRFALSSGNTVGIVKAQITSNVAGGYFGDVSFPLESVRPAATPVEPTSVEHFATYKPTLVVGTLELEQTVAALPRLLPQLGIPVDAVGLVLEETLAPFVGRPWSSDDSPVTVDIPAAATAAPPLIGTPEAGYTTVPEVPDRSAPAASLTPEPGLSMVPKESDTSTPVPPETPGTNQQIAEEPGRPAMADQEAAKTGWSLGLPIGLAAALVLLVSAALLLRFGRGIFVRSRG